MSMSTIFVLIGPSELKGVALSTDPAEALRELTIWFGPGEVYACRISDSAAAEVRSAVTDPQNMPRGKTPTTALTLLKRYSQSMQKVADV